MTFDEILDQAIAMLQHRRRVSYRALKRQFALDEAYLEDLKHEIITVHRLAVDQDGEMLCWAGDTAFTPPPVRASAPPHKPAYPAPPFPRRARGRWSRSSMTPFSLRRKKALNTGDPRMTPSGQTAEESREVLFACAHLDFLRKTLTSSGLIKSGTVQPSRSYSAMHCSAKPL